MAVFFCTLITVAGALLLYLCSGNQRWLARPLPVPLRALAGCLWALSLPLWMTTLSAKAGLFAALTLQMLLLGVLPLLSLLRGPAENP
ncbi:hypothetical protein CEK62_03945 [Alcanivorax sp. N3-2A]|nr:hypothetical protein CEK62_03945 [Alcanivorax sp. N3-2A]